MVSKNVITILSVVTCLFTLTSVGLTAYHSVAHTYIKDKDSGLVIKTSGTAPGDCPPAVKIKIEDDNTLSVASCPFKPATKAIAFISLILCQFLLILLCCKLKNKVSSMVIIIFAIIDFPLLFVGGILMIVDMVNGKKELGILSDMQGFSYQPIEFIIDILFLFFGMICGGIATFFAYTSKPPASSNFRGSQPTQHGNASMSVTKPHWTEGESQSQSTDYIKPYPQTNISTYQAYQGGSVYGSQNTSAAYLHSNNPNTSISSPNGRASQAYQPQNEQYLESSQNYDNAGGNRRNTSYKDNPQTRQRQQSNANNYNQGGNQQANNTYENNPQRNMNRNMNNNTNLTYETNNNNANQNNYNNTGAQNNYNANQNNNNSMAGPQSRASRNNYPTGSNQSQMYSNNNNEAPAYERSPERNPERSPDRNYANSGNGGNGRPNKFNSAVNRIGAMRGGTNAFESGSNNKGYLNYGSEANNNQGNTNNYDENPLEYYNSSPNNRARARSNNQSNYQEGEGNYQRGNQRNTHVSQMNGNNISSNNNNGMSRPSQNYGGGY